MLNLKPLAIIMPGLILVLALVVACGSAAEPQESAAKPESVTTALKFPSRAAFTPFSIFSELPLEEITMSRSPSSP